jgi:hypothetical protein
MSKLSERLEKLANDFNNLDNELLVLADEENDEVLLSVISEAVVAVSSILKTAHEFVEKNIEKTSKINRDDLDELVAIANEFDASGDPALVRQASVLDQLLINFAQSTSLESKEEAELNRLRDKMKSEKGDELYKGVRKELQKQINADDAIKAIDKQTKIYRPLEAPLSTRSCPDHIGSQMTRVSDNVFQCPLDQKTYDYNEGFTTERGNKVPGGSVSNQTQNLVDSVRQQTTSFGTTREQKIGERAE